MKQNIIVSKLKFRLHIKVIVKIKHHVNGDGTFDGKNGSGTNSYAIKTCVILIDGCWYVDTLQTELTKSSSKRLNINVS